MILDDYIARAEELLKLAEDVYAARRRDEWGLSSVDGQTFTQLRAACLSFLRNLFGPDHPYYQDFDSKVTDTYAYESETAIGILRAVHNELVGGWIRTTKGLVSAEIFADFLEMAAYLLSEHYTDAAAVMVGSVLEGHLRQLCDKYGIDTYGEKAGKRVHEKADTLNAELAKKSVYNKLDQKSVTAWLDLRNKAAHGDYGAYSEDQVQLMLQGVGQFMSRLPV